MKKVVEYLKKETVFVIAFILAIVSMFFVHPDKEYVGYMNLSVLSILFCLMLVVAGFESAGLFEVFTQKIYKSIKSEKILIVFMTFVCFFSSALVTNDIALITFVPFTISLLRTSKSKTLIFAVVMETVAANLGSLITPIGNPQNLFLYTYYSMSAGEFFSVTLPLGCICALLIGIIFIGYRSKQKINPVVMDGGAFDIRKTIIFTLLFALCILCVFEIVHYGIVFAAVCLSVLIVDAKLFKKADYNLLITFICFFVFVGNVARIDAVYDFVIKIISGRELVCSALLSQIISNVPAATMLASFTGDAGSLILGTNIGGLGTLIASMASLISYRQICNVDSIKKSEYIFTFTVINFVLLIILLSIYTII